MRWIVVAVMAAMLAVAPVAWAASMHPAHPGVLLVTPDGQIAQPYQRWADQAQVPTAPTRVVLSLTPCPDIVELACAEPNPPRVWIDAGQPFLRRSNVRGMLYHELGHIFDYTVMTDAARARFLAIAGTPARAWRSPPNSPHEQFAEAYRLCAIGSPPIHHGRVQGGVGYSPRPRTHRRVCALIRRVANGRS